MNKNAAEAQRLTFSKVLAETNDASLAYTEAFPQKAKDVDAERIAIRGKDLAKSPKVKALVEEILQGCRTQIILLAPAAIDRIEELARNAESEKVKLEANRDILARAGLNAPEQVQLTQVGVFGVAGFDDVKNFIRQNMEEVVDVTPEKESE